MTPTTNTTYTERFAQALALLCNNLPPLDKVQAWIDGDNEDLQEWAINNTMLAWARGIAVLDAAHVLADQPAEGEGPEPKPEKTVADYLAKATELPDQVQARIDHEFTISAARSNFCDDDLEIDDVPLVLGADGGVWVSAWVWVNTEAEES